MSLHALNVTGHSFEKNERVIETNDKMGQDKIRFGNHFLFCKWVSTQTVHNRYFLSLTQ